MSSEYGKKNLLFQQMLFTGVILSNNRQERLSCNRFELFNSIDSKHYIVENSISMPQSVTVGAFHLVKISGIFGSAVNGTRFVVSSDWKIPRKSGKSKKVGPFSRLEFSNGISSSIYTFLVVCTSSRSTARKSVTASYQIKMASLDLMYQSTVWFFAGPTMDALLHHECPGLGLISKYLEMSKSNIYSEVHIH